MLQDTKQRKQCLDITKSYIVQAPAGSGKTSILVQRYLALLSNVEKYPEEILAITFTRLAAYEMRDRIINALKSCFENSTNISEYEKVTYNLAKKVLQRDKLENWNLISNPSRLKIQTFDSLCSSIVKKLPIATNFGQPPKVLAESDELYQKAVDDFLLTDNLEEGWEASRDLLLLHLDNDWNLLKDLFVEMLSKREQWLSYIVSMEKKHNIKEILEEGLQKEIVNVLSKTKDMVLKESERKVVLNEIPRLVKIAFSYGFRSSLSSKVVEAHSDSSTNETEDIKSDIEKLQSCFEVAELKNQKSCKSRTTEAIYLWPKPNVENLKIWQSISELLLTKNGTVRKSVTKNQGFPSKGTAKTKEEKNLFDENKKLMLSCLKELSNCNSLIKAFNEIAMLPEANYLDSDWEVIEAIMNLLPVLVGFLQVVFKETSKVDFNEISIAANSALGNNEHCSDLGLSLGYKIKHILVDEFQDTSILQFNLLQKLTQTWEVEDRKTLFLVGDPMQSIYLFRQAEVGLFLTAKNYGIGNVKLIPLSLSSNFRSTEDVVNWNNEFFAKMFPKHDDIASGSISFTESVAASQDKPEAKGKLTIEDELTIAVKNEHKTNYPSVKIITNDTAHDSNHEVDDIINIIKTEQKHNPSAKIAILVRARSHLQDIIPGLKQANIPFNGVDIESLSERSVIRDLNALTRAILHLGDCIAWLAILRSPWCGLSLDDIYILANTNNKAIIYENIQNDQVLSLLSKSGQHKLKKIRSIIEISLNNITKLPLAELIYDLWIKLNNLNCLLLNSDMEDANEYFNFLATIDIDDTRRLYEIGYIESKLKKLYSKLYSLEANSVQIMTIHKAKGLEFDVVILPSLNKRTNIAKKRLFYLMEKIDANKKAYLMFSAIKSSKENGNKIYNYLKNNFEQKELQEMIRVFYVACTRAKSKLYCHGIYARTTSVLG